MPSPVNSYTQSRVRGSWVAPSTIDRGKLLLHLGFMHPRHQ